MASISKTIYFLPILSFSIINCFDATTQIPIQILLFFSFFFYHKFHIHKVSAGHSSLNPFCNESVSKYGSSELEIRNEK